MESVAALVTATSASGDALGHLTRALLIGSAALLAAVLAVRLSERSGLPSLLLYLGIGVAIGESGLGVRFDSAVLTQVLGYAALVLILAEGGLTTSWPAVRRAVVPAAVLSTLGVVVSVLVVGLAGHYLLGFDWTLAMLIGAILTSTDAAAVFSVLRTVPLPRRLTGALEAESGFNDAPVVLLVVALADALAPGAEPINLVRLVGLAALELAGGAVIGVLVGFVGGIGLRRVAGASSALFSIGVLALTVLAYAASAAAHVSGFLATYLAGLVLGNMNLPHRAPMRSFAQALGWLAQIGLFVLLGLMVSPPRLAQQVVPALVLGLVLLLLARPLSILVSMTPFGLGWRDQVFLSWAGLRGAVPIVLATVPMTVVSGDARWILDLVFVLVVVFTFVQAPTLGPLAARLGLIESVASTDVELETTPLEELGASVLHVTIGPESRLHGVEVFELRLPRGANVTMVVRDGEGLVPQRTTRLRHGDELLVVTPNRLRERTDARIRSMSREGRLAGWSDAVD